MSDKNSIGAGLLAEDGLTDADAAERRRTHLREVLDLEKKYERKVRSAAASAWLVTFVTLPTGVMTLLAAGGGGDARAGVLLTCMGSLGLLAALMTTVAWLWRSRVPALTAIEARLAALEQLLITRRDAGR